MSRVLSLALKINADASGVRLTPVERALKRLGDETAKVTSVFDKFGKSSEAAARAQEQTSKSINDLITARRAGTITAEEFAKQFAAVAEGAKQEAAALERAARITEANLSPLERYDRALEELNEQFKAGRISQETYARATEGAAKGLTDAERAARGLAVQQKEIDNAAANTTLKFNELSGVFAVLPGPLGNIAGRISGLTSAGEGLQRVFAGGLAQGFSNVAASVTALINPVTLALAGVTAFAAGASAVARGLVDLEDRVERLGRLANQLGVSFEFVQVLEEAGNRADVSIEQLSGSFARLQNTLAGADEESKKAAAALQGLGVSVQEFGALSEQDQIRLIGRQLAEIEDPAQRSAAAIELFGRSGVQLLPFFKELPQAASDIERFGSAISDEDRQRVADLGAAYDEFSVALRSLSQNVLLPFVDAASAVTRGLADLIDVVSRIANVIGTALEPVLTQVAILFEVFGSAVSTIGGAVLSVFESLVRVLEPIGSFILPAIVAQVTFLNRAIIAGAISGLARTFTAASAAAIAYATSAGTAATATVALGAAIRATLASTGIGALVVGIGLAANALISYFTAAEDTAESLDKTGESAKTAADEAARLREELAKQDAADETAAARAIDSVRESLSKAIDESQQFGQAGFDAAVEYQTAINELQRQFDKGILNEESFRREAERASAAYTAQIDVIKAAAAETEAITARVDGLLAKANELPKAQQDLNAVEAEIARVEASLVSARAAGQTEQADALAARLAQLDQLQAGLEQQADETAQGFSQGFDAAFANVDSGINSLIDKAAEFGNEGALAASQLQAGIAAAQEQVRDGILTKQAFDAEVERQKELFETRVAQLQQAEKIAEQIADKEASLLDRQFEIELARAEELANVRSGSIQLNDIREGGIGAFFDTLQEDPAIAEAKKQSKELEQIRKGIAALQAERVEILAGTG